MTIAALLDQSLAGLQRRTHLLAQRKASARKRGRFSLSATLLSSRAQEAELLVRRYRDCPTGAVGEASGWELEGWRFHR